ncbi:hypothetical protein K402DRAFT_344006, partial [Aulographum hederae CBS 113979]
IYNEITKALGVPQNETKNTVGTVVDVLGFRIDTQKMETRLSPEKQARALSSLQLVLKHNSITRKQAETLAGYLAWCAHVIRLGRSYSRSLWEFISSWPDSRGTDWEPYAASLPQSSALSAAHSSPKSINVYEMEAIALAFSRWAPLWQQSSVCVHTDSQVVHNGLQKTVLQGEANTPLPIRSWESFCALHGKRPYPAQIYDLGEWIAQRAFGNSQPGMSRVKGETLRAYVAAIRSAHVDRNHSIAVFESPLINRLVAGAVNISPSRRREKMPVTRDILEKVVTLRGSQIEATADAAFTLAFAGFLRMGEITYTKAEVENRTEFHSAKATRGDVVIGQEGLTLRLKASKTDRQRHGVHIAIARTGGLVCPVSAMEKLLSLDLQPPNAPLFNLNGNPFTPAAAHSGCSYQQLQQLGRWNSEAFHAYIRHALPDRHALNLKFQRGKGKSQGLG